MSEKIEKRFCTHCNRVTMFRLRKNEDIYDEKIDNIHHYNARKLAECFGDSMRNLALGALNEVTLHRFDFDKSWCCSKCGKD